MYIVSLLVTVAVGANMSVASATSPSIADRVTANTVSKVISIPTKQLTSTTKTSGLLLPKTSLASDTDPTQSAPKPSLAGAKLFVDPSVHTLGDQAVGKWLGGWNTDIKMDSRAYISAAEKANTVPLLVLYDVPGRDCGSYSAGGAAQYSDYNTWIQQVARGIGMSKVIVVLEPDAVASLDCLDTNSQDARLHGLASAVSILKANPQTFVYIDGGNARWQKPEVMAARLKSANIAEADGFSLNVSNYISTSESTNYGTKISQELGGKHFIIDTSRNGNGPAPGSEWCNPSGRALGNKPTLSTGNAIVDAYLWIKVPGESDGTCNGGPSAGSWWQSYADQLLQNSKL